MFKRKSSKLGPVRVHRSAGKRGLLGNHGTGAVAYIPVPLSWRGTTRQLCGLYPWSTTGRLPMVGAPLGRHAYSKAVVCFDHISWFRAGLIANPSVLILAKPGLGKSTTASRLMLFLSSQGYKLLIPGDTKPDYVKLTRELGGDVKSMARAGGAGINPCDPGGMIGAGRQMIAAGETASGEALIAEGIGRAVVCISALVELSRKGRATTDYEETALAHALRILYGRSDFAASEPLIGDVDDLLGSRPKEIRDAILDRADDSVYDDLIEPLRRSIRSLLNGQFGDVFSKRTDRVEGSPAFCLDTSKIKAGDPRFLAAVMLAAWSDTYGMVEANQALADVGMAERVLYCMVLDELWRVLNLGGSLPDRVNELTRLNRTDGIGQIQITHSMNDLQRSGNSTVEGLEERAGAILIGAVPKKELDRIGEVLTLNEEERRAISSWWSVSQAMVTGAGDGKQVPPGAGMFLLKMSADDPGIPIKVTLSSVERKWGGQNTNETWDNADRQRKARRRTQDGAAA